MFVGDRLTAQGHTRTVSRRAIQRENLLISETTAREMRGSATCQGLELIALIVVKQPCRPGRTTCNQAEFCRFLPLQKQKWLNHAVGG